jgi:hypothetical protein
MDNHRENRKKSYDVPKYKQNCKSVLIWEKNGPRSKVFVEELVRRLVAMWGIIIACECDVNWSKLQAHIIFADDMYVWA